MEDPFYALRKFVAPEFIFGRGAMARCAEYAATFGASRPLIVSDEGVAAAGWAGRVEAQLRDGGADFTRFYDVSPNPRDAEVMAGAELFLRERCDMIIAVGGGSPMDCAKGIGAVATNGGHILDFEGVDKVPEPMPPLVCVPTTSGTAADLSQFAIILDLARRTKIAIISKGMVPDISLSDPETTVTMDAELTAETGMDALTHAFEAYASNASSPVTDLHALEATRLIAASLPTAAERPHDLAARSRMMMGSLLAGLAFSNASLGIVHAMAHAMGGLLDLPHGLCNALLLERAVAFNCPAAPERYAALGEALLGRSLFGTASDEIAGAVCEGLASLRRRLGLGGRVEIEPLPRRAVSELAAMALADPCVVTNPRRPEADEIEALYAAVLPVA